MTKHVQEMMRDIVSAGAEAADADNRPGVEAARLALMGALGFELNRIADALEKIAARHGHDEVLEDL